MQQIVYCYGIVVRGKRPFLRLYVKLLVMFQHVVESLPERMITIRFEFGIDLLVSQEDVRDFKWNHHQWNIAFDSQNSFIGERVAIDVELRRRCDVAGIDGSSHQNDFAELLLDLREGHHQQT